MACTAVGTTGRREAGGCERDGADNLATPACSSMHLNSSLWGLHHSPCSSEPAGQKGLVQGARGDSIREPHAKAARKGARGMECKERVCSDVPRGCQHGAQAPRGPLAVSRDHFIGQRAQVGWRAGQDDLCRCDQGSEAVIGGDRTPRLPPPAPRPAA